MTHRRFRMLICTDALVDQNCIALFIGRFPLFISLMVGFTMVNPKIVWGAQAYSTITSKFTVRLGQNRFSGTNIDLAVFKNRTVDRMANFLNLVFLITLPKMTART
jgi:hypothetical protein